MLPLGRAHQSTLAPVESESGMHRRHTPAEAGTTLSNLRLHQLLLRRAVAVSPKLTTDPSPCRQQSSSLHPLPKYPEYQCSQSLCLQALTFLSTLSPKRMFFLSYFPLDSRDSYGFDVLLQLREAKMFPEPIKMSSCSTVQGVPFMKKTFQKDLRPLGSLPQATDSQ